MGLIFCRHALGPLYLFLTHHGGWSLGGHNFRAVAKVATVELYFAYKYVAGCMQHFEYFLKLLQFFYKSADEAGCCSCYRLVPSKL